MKKATILSFIFTLVSFGTIAQGYDMKLGIKLAPTFGHSRTLLDDRSVSVVNDGTSFKLSIGLIADRTFGNNYIFSTGIIYLPKTVSIALDGTDQIFNRSESYKLQYLQIPGTIKLFTSEIQPSMRIYFQLGLALELKVYEEADPDLVNDELISQFAPFNIPVILGLGAEYEAGLSTIFFAGLSYQRGLTSIIDTTDNNYRLNEDLSIRTTIFSIDAGVKF